MAKIKVGFVGAGTHANLVHYPSLALMDDVEIVAICDINKERLYSTAEKYNVKKTYTDYRRMFEKENLDAVYIIMPPHILYDIVVEAIENGLNVFIEKPPGVTSYQTYNLSRMAKREGVHTMVGFNRRFIPLIRTVKEAVEREGEIVYCTSTFYKFYKADYGYYNGAIDILTCDAIHAVDMLRWICGEPKKVASIIKGFGVEYPNSFNALIEFEKGKVGFLRTFWVAGSRLHTFEFHTIGISAYVDPDDKASIFYNNKPPVVITTFEVAGSRDRIFYYGFYNENRHFIESIKNDEEPLTNFHDAYKTMKLVDDIRIAGLNI